ncbi:Iron-sulfur clusters incorporation protein, partial [Chytridiales sp. JEL 0842]
YRQQQRVWRYIGGMFQGNHKREDGVVVVGDPKFLSSGKGGRSAPTARIKRELNKYVYQAIGKAKKQDSDLFVAVNDLVQAIEAKESLVLDVAGDGLEGTGEDLRDDNDEVDLDESKGRRLNTTVTAHDWLAESNLKDRYTTVPNRGLIELEGVDAVKFLQGMVTNQMTKVERGGDGILAAFLSAQNRGHDFPHPVFIIECDARAVDPLMKHLKRYTLRSKVKLSNVSDQFVTYQAWGPSAASTWTNYQKPDVFRNVPVGGLLSKERFTDIGCKDPRHKDLGFRFVRLRDEAVNLPNFSKVDSEDYTLRRLLYGIPEGMDDFFTNTSLPLESNLDMMSGVDFRKGCYLGQELTIRTYHTGVTRKRIVPVQLIPEGEDCDSTVVTLNKSSQIQQPPSGTDVRIQGVTGRKGEAGKYCSGIYNVGLALMRLDHVTTASGHSPTLTVGEGLRLKPFIPTWWPTVSSEATAPSA